MSSPPQVCELDDMQLVQAKLDFNDVMPDSDCERDVLAQHDNIYEASLPLASLEHAPPMESLKELAITLAYDIQFKNDSESELATILAQDVNFENDCESEEGFIGLLLHSLSHHDECLVDSALRDERDLLELQHHLSALWKKRGDDAPALHRPVASTRRC